MARNLQDKLAKLDSSRSARVKTEADHLHTEYLALQALRKAKKPTRVQVTAPPASPGTK